MKLVSSHSRVLQKHRTVLREYIFVNYIQTPPTTMSIPQIFSLAAIEIVGDYGLKEYANKGGWHFLATGLVGYVSLIIMLIIALQGSTLLLVNNAWDGASSILESIFAFFILGERLDNYMQYIGICMIISGMTLLKIPWKKAHPFHIPSLNG